MAVVYLGIGSNIGDKEANCAEAIERLEGSDEIKILNKSSLYFTDPIGGPPQDDYLNGVLKIETQLSPLDVLNALKEIERMMGREEAERNAPRVIDIDILLFDEMILKCEDLTIPHPRMHERDFVLKGMLEMAPEAYHPVLGVRIEEI